MKYDLLKTVLDYLRDEGAATPAELEDAVGEPIQAAVRELRKLGFDITVDKEGRSISLYTYNGDGTGVLVDKAAERAAAKAAKAEARAEAKAEREALKAEREAEKAAAKAAKAEARAKAKAEREAAEAEEEDEDDWSDEDTYEDIVEDDKRVLAASEDEASYAVSEDWDEDTEEAILKMFR